MSLTPKRRATEKTLASSRQNGRKSRGAVTPEGKVRAARANLRHGFYAEAPEAVLSALGEDPEEYRHMMSSLQTNLPEGLEEQLVQQIGRTLWRMQRAERVQDGLAVQRVKAGLQMEQLMGGPRLLKINQTYEDLCAIGKMLHRPDSNPTGEEIEALINAFGPNPPEDVQKLFPLLRSFGEAVSKASGRAKENGDTGAIPSADEAPEREAARRMAADALNATIVPRRMGLDEAIEAHDRINSPENIAAMIAPREENALLMQRMEDSSLRQLWRLTNILVKIRRGVLD